MHPRIVGIVNLSGDSFSAGGRLTDPSAAVARGVDYVRTHDVRALCDAVAVVRALEGGV